MHRPAEFLFTLRLLLFSRLFSLIFDKAGVFVGSSVVCTSCFSFLFSVFTMSIRFLFCFLFLPSSPFSSSAFITSSFLLRICVYIFLLLISLSFSGGFLVTEIFSPILILIFALGAKVSKCISESFCRSGYIPCRIGKDGGFTRRDRSFQGST